MHLNHINDYNLIRMLQINGMRAKGADNSDNIACELVPIEFGIKATAKIDFELMRVS